MTTSRYFQRYPDISRPFHLAHGEIRPLTDDGWDFYLASVFGDVPTLREVHGRNPQVEATIHYEFPLLMAVRQGRADAVRFLLEATGGAIDGGPATSDNVWFSRCVEAAQARGFTEIQEMLEQCRGRANALAASGVQHAPDETLKPMLRSGDLHALQTRLAREPRLTEVSRDDQWQLLRWAYEAAVDEAVICEMLELLLQQGIDPNCGPLIHYASEKNSLPIVRLLLERGANPNTVIDSCSNCMWIAKFANPDDYQAMHALLQSYGGRIMLHDLDEVPSASELLAADAETREVLYPTGELLWSILREDDVRMLDRFVELYGTAQIQTVSPGNHWYDPRSTSMIDRLVEYGFHVNQRDWRGRTMIFLAEFDRFPDYMRHGADVNVVEFMECSTRLGYAAFHNNLEMAEFLLAHGADPQLPAEHAWARPRAHAEAQEYEEMVALLAKHGAT